MLVSLRLEAIGEAGSACLRLLHGRVRDAFNRDLADALVGEIPDRWGVWELDGQDHIFRPMYGRKDYSRSNSKGTRGVYVYYALPPGRYLVHAPESWSRTDKYICTVTEAGEVVRERTL